ncbi:MAG: ribonuclease R [Nanoarchaeota archaeon]
MVFWLEKLKKPHKRNIIAIFAYNIKNNEAGSCGKKKNLMKEKNQAEGIIEIARNGHAYLIVESKGFKDDLFVHKDNLGHALDGDRVNVSIIPDESGKGSGIQGVVSGIIKRKKTDFSGVIEINQEKRHAFVRTSGQKMPVDIYVPLENINGAKDGEVVVARLHRWHKKDKSPTGIVVKVLGKAETHETEMGNIMFKHNIDYNFSSKVEEEANSIPVEIPEDEILKRRDMRDVLTITIDPETAKDFDDAISFQKLENGNYEIGVHIADVTHYVRKGSELDKEAYERATSVYLVDRCIPMLPERLSNGICSLRPHEDKLTFSVIFEITSEGEVVKHNFKKTVINSDGRFTYEQAQEIIEASNGGVSITAIQGVNASIDAFACIPVLNGIARKLREKRFKSGAVSFHRREPQFILDKNGVPTDVFFHESAEAHELIEEYMLLANRYVATYAYGLNRPFVYRTHDLPDREKLEELAAFVSQFGYSLRISDSVAETKESLNKLLKDAQDTGESNMIETLAIRSMSKAIYSTQVIGHYGLGFKHYSHFTSPIRRYPDVMAHRLLWEYLQNRTGDVSKIGDQCEHCSDMENRAAKAQRESIKYKQCEYLKSRIGKQFKGIISGVTEFGAFVEIIENGCEGLISKETLERASVFVDEKNFCINNFNNGESYRLGDEIMVEVSKVNMTRKLIDFKIIINQ